MYSPLEWRAKKFLAADFMKEPLNIRTCGKLLMTRSSSSGEPSDNRTKISIFRYVWAEMERKHISNRSGSASGANGSITDISSLSARFTFIVKQMLACGISHRKQHRSCTTSMKLCDVDQDVDDEKKRLETVFDLRVSLILITCLRVTIGCERFL